MCGSLCCIECNPEHLVVRGKWCHVADACFVDVLVHWSHDVVTLAPGSMAIGDFLVPGVFSVILLFESAYSIIRLELGKESSYFDVPRCSWVLKVCIKALFRPWFWPTHTHTPWLLRCEKYHQNCSKRPGFFQVLRKWCTRVCILLRTPSFRQKVCFWSVICPGTHTLAHFIPHGMLMLMYMDFPIVM